MLYGRDDGVLAAVLSEQESAFARAGLTRIAKLDTNWLPKGREHFGFRDGVSQTDIEGFHTDARPENTIAAGEFILGYRNAYGQYTQRPLVRPDQDPRGLLQPAPDDPARRDLGMNGSYLVFRQLRQDVAGFWKYIDEQAKRIPARPGSERDACGSPRRWSGAGRAARRWSRRRTSTIRRCATTTTSCTIARRRSAGLEVPDRRAHPARESA